MLNVDNYTHYNVNLTNSTANGQTFAVGMACIVSGIINIINSILKHNFTNHHAGMFYIDESHTTVNGGLFINP